MRYRIDHHWLMRYAAPVREHHIQVRLAPWSDEGQTLTRLELNVTPEVPAVARRDGFGNLSHHFAVLGAHQAVEFELCAEVETRLSNPFDFPPVEPARERSWLEHSLHEAPRLWDFVLHQGPLTAALPEEVPGGAVPDWQPGIPLLTQIQEAFAWIKAVAEYDPEAQDSVSALPALFDAGRGTAADLSHLLIALLRRWGVPARFVSGYQDAAYFEPDEEAPAGAEPRPQRLHNWTEALIPGAGWRGFDPALALLADETYIRVAVGRDASDVSPLRQTSKGSGDAPIVEERLSVTRLPEEGILVSAPIDGMGQSQETETGSRVRGSTENQA
ncbi:MAG: transglutaminase family protein [Chromatiaceae bacterium]